MPQRKLKQFRSKNASLWQSAVDRVAVQASATSPGAGFDMAGAAPPAGRPEPQDPETAAAIRPATISPK